MPSTRNTLSPPEIYFGSAENEAIEAAKSQFARDLPFSAEELLDQSLDLPLLDVDLVGVEISGVYCFYHSAFFKK